MGNEVTIHISPEGVPLKKGRSRKLSRSIEKDDAFDTMETETKPREKNLTAIWLSLERLLENLQDIKVVLIGICGLLTFIGILCLIGTCILLKLLT
jgi:hypothetical protein